MFWIVVRMHIFFRSQNIALQLNSFVIEKAYNDTDIHRYGNFSMTGNLVLRKKTLMIKAKVKVEISLEKVISGNVLTASEFLEIC